MNKSNYLYPTNFAIMHSQGNYTTPPHIKLIEDKLLELCFGKISKLIVTLPPRHGKSELISKYFPAWYLMINPQARIMLASYESSFAESWSIKAKDVYKYFDGKVTIDRQSYWETIHGGSMTATGVGGAITGKGANLLIIDDPIKNNIEAYSETYRNRIWDWYLSTAYTRLEPGAKIIIMLTRWHYDDLAGRILKQDEKKEWTVINLPALANENDPLGRQIGEPLWAERFNLDALNNIKQTIGSAWYSALYQQEPTNAELQIIKTEWWQYFKEDVSFDYKIQSWDTAFKTDKQSDYSVCTTWGISGDKYYLLDTFIDKLEFPELEKQAQNLFFKHKPINILIEDKASGQSLIQSLQRNTSLPVTPIKVVNDKIIRCHSTAPTFEQKRIFILADQQWTADVINNFALFPFADHDDIVDSVTQFINYMITTNFNFNIRRM